MKVLVACEESGIVRDAFIERGHDAMSCDLLPTDKPGAHYQGDVFDVLNTRYDLIIAHPPCTALAVSGNRWYGKGMPMHSQRITSAQWTENLWNRCVDIADHVCLENPVGVLNKLTGLPRPQYIQPWMFGHGETKKTGLWLHNLPPLEPTDIVDGREQRIWKMPPSADRAKERSRTYLGIASAMAEQWGSL